MSPPETKRPGDQTEARKTLSCPNFTATTSAVNRGNSSPHPLDQNASPRLLARSRYGLATGSTPFCQIPHAMNYWNGGPHPTTAGDLFHHGGNTR